MQIVPLSTWSWNNSTSVWPIFSWRETITTPTKLSWRNAKRNATSWWRRKPDTKNDPWTYFKLSHSPNEKIPFIVDCLELKTDQKYGRHIVTTRDLQPGDVIAIEKIVFPNIQKTAIYSRCSFCSSHVIEKVTRTLAQQVTLVHLFTRTYLIFLSFCSNVLQSGMFGQESRYVPRCCLWTNRRDMGARWWRRNNFNLEGPDRVFLHCGRSHRASSGSHEQQQSNYNLQLWYRAVSQKSEMEPILVEYSTRLAMIKHRHSLSNGILPFGGLYSHSCDANVFLVHIDDTMVHVVTKPISEGKQLFICYG